MTLGLGFILLCLFSACVCQGGGGNPVPCAPDSSWTQCNATCGGGTATRVKNCVTEYQECNTQDCPVDCTWNAWGAFSDCSTSCGPGVKTQTRTKNNAQNGGKDCSGSNSNSQNCNKGDCPSDCVWNDWGNWSPCSVSCAQGTQTQTRTVKTPAQNGGKDCTGKSSNTQNCNQGVCPVDCQLGPWSSWVCSVTCGNGTQTSTRTITVQKVGNGADCSSNTSISQPCTRLPCPVPCLWGPYTDWNPCSVTCGSGGVQTRSRNRTQTAQFGGTPCDGSAVDSRPCTGSGDPGSICPIDCTYNPWGDFSTCTATCGPNGTKTATRSTNKEQNGGAPCTESLFLVEPCNVNINCPINCVWGQWTTGPCSLSCGGGIQTRTRVISVQAQYGGSCPGQQAPGQLQQQESQSCNIFECTQEPVDCSWNNFTDWQCDTSTCIGTETRYRTKNEALNGGAACVGTDVESRQCVRPCPTDCTWTPWSTFGSCSAPCGGGTQTRTRDTIDAVEGGAPCTGDPRQVQACNIQACDGNSYCGNVTCSFPSSCLVDEDGVPVCVGPSDSVVFFQLVISLSPNALFTDVKAFIEVELAKFFPARYLGDTTVLPGNGTYSLIISISNETATSTTLATFDKTFPLDLASSADFQLLEMFRVDPSTPPRPPRATTLTGQPTVNETETYLGFKVGSMGAAVGILIVVILVPVLILGSVIAYFLTHKTDKAFDEYEQL